MTPYELIRIFDDTQTRIQNDPALQQQMLKSQCGSQLYLEAYESPVRKVKSHGNVNVIESTTVQCARDLFRPSAKIAVLNFANPHEPGGGVRRGAMAQEECLCRCSDLYNILAQPYFQKHYYEYHYVHSDNFFSDRLIYAPGVTFFKTDDPVPQLLENPFLVDVITCAAPYLSGYPGKTQEELLEIYTSRIRNILEVAMANDVDDLILGAFGCGAFRNNPELMAKAFSQLLIHEGYACFFEKVVFAIKKTGMICQNLRAFQRELCPAVSEKNRYRFWK